MTRMGRVRISTSGWSGGPGLNTFYFVNRVDPLTWGSQDTEDVLTRVQAALNAYKQNWPSFVAAQVNQAVDVLNPENGQLLESTFGTGQTYIQATGGTTCLPIAAALCMTLLTNDVVGGHRVRGRAFFSPIASGADNDGTPTGTQTGRVVTLGDSLRSVSVGNQNLVVWHRPKSGGGGSAHVTSSIICRDKFAVLRSRRD
jgi:hypothetical protein